MEQQPKKSTEVLEKLADAVNAGAKKLDEGVDKRGALGEFSPALTVGIIVMLVVAVINQPNLLILGVLGGAVAMSPKIMRYVRRKKAEMALKDAAKQVAQPPKLPEVVDTTEQK